MQALFALHLFVVAGIPPEISHHVWESSLHHDVHPYDTAATLISEHSGPQWDYSLLSADHSIDWTARDGADGETGLMQVMPRWYKAAGADTADTSAATNIDVAAYVIAQAQASHADGSKARHWVEHYKCKRSARGTQCGQCGYASRKWQRIRASLTRITTPRALHRSHQKLWANRCMEGT